MHSYRDSATSRSLLKAASGDPGNDSEESLLETPTYSIVLVLLAFQVVSILFTVLVKSVQHLLRTRRRFGLLEAVNHSVHELTLLGFVSIVLLTLEEVIAKVCIDASYFRANWTVLQFVYGEDYCPCCLENTKHVQACVRAYASCGDMSGDGDQYCNCDQQDPSCVIPFYKEGSTVPYEEEVCEGPVALDGKGQCSEGKVRAVSILALEQTHYLIFLLSIVHVLSGFLLYGLAWLRVKWEWGRWEKVHDEHHDKVKEVLEGYYSDLTTTLYRRSVGTNPAHSTTGNSRHGSRGDDDGALVDRDQSIVSSPPEFGGKPGGEHVDDGIDEAENGGEEGKDGFGGSHVEQNGAIDVNGSERKRRVTVAFPDSEEPQGGPPKLERRSATMPAILGREAIDEESGLNSIRRSLTRSKSFHDLVTIERQLRTKIVSRAKQWSRASCSYSKDRVHTIFQGMGPFIVSRSQYYKLRASFIYTHKLGGNFNFLAHVTNSMEDDLAHLVGVTPFFWLITMIFWLISGVIGYAVMPFMALTAILMVVLNAKLVSIVKGIVSKLGSGHALILEERIFWFNKPELMLQPMKFCLFFTSYIWTSFIFFAWQFGGSSCAFTDPFYGKSWVLPWWTIIFFNAVIFLHLAMVTFPAYSLAVQMGSNLKGHMLPSRFVKKLLKAVDDAKQQVEAEARLKREQEGIVDGKQAAFNRLFRRSAGAIGTQAGAAFLGMERERRLQRTSSEQRWM